MSPTLPTQLRTHRKALSITVGALLVLITALQGWVDAVGADYTERGFKRALVTFAVARGLNGVISVAQGTEVALQPAGIGINFTPGQILDPVNDLIERFSWVMLTATTSLGLQKLLLTIFTSPAFNTLLAIALGLAVAATWLVRNRPRLRAVGYRIALALIMIRFAIPVVAICSEGIYRAFLAEQYELSTSEIEQTTERIGRINQRAEERIGEASDASLFEQAKRLYNQAVQSFDIDAYLAQYKQAASAASEHTINLIVIFVLQTILLPLGFLWLLAHLIRRVIHTSFKL